MADLVRDHVRRGEVARRAEAPRELLEEREVEVHLVVGRAVERARSATDAGAAPGLRAAREGDDRRARVLPVGRGEELRPRVLRVLGDELRELEDGRPRLPGCAPGARRRRRLEAAAGREAAVPLPPPPMTLPAEEQRHHDDDDETEAAARLAHRDGQTAAAEHPPPWPRRSWTSPWPWTFFHRTAGAYPRRSETELGSRGRLRPAGAVPRRACVAYQPWSGCSVTPPLDEWTNQPLPT